MKLREDKWLEEQIAGWVSEKLITAPQAKSILGKYKKDPAGSAFNASLLLAGLGGLCVALGIALVVSYNWEKIPALVKMAGFLGLLAIVAEGTRWVSERNKILKTALLLLWFVLPLAGIGLWAQIYQLSGDPLKPLLVWLLLGLPLVLRSGNGPLAFFHTAGLVWAVFVGAFERGTWLSLVESGSRWWRDSSDISFSRVLAGFGPAFLGVLLLWAFIVLQARRRLGNKARLAAFFSFMAFIWFLYLENTPFNCDGIVHFTVAGAILTLYWGLRNAFQLDRHPWEGWGYLFAFAALYALTFLWHGGSSYNNGSLFSAVFAIGLLLVGAVLAGLLDLSDMVSSNLMIRVLKFLILVPGLLGLALLAGFSYKSAAVLANLAFLGFAVWHIREGIEMKEAKRINQGMILVGLLILTRFIDYFGTMLQSGIAFIVMGLLFVGVSWALNQGRKKLLAEVGRRG